MFCFNSRARVGRDLTLAGNLNILKVCFNSRARVGRDP